MFPMSRARFLIGTMLVTIAFAAVPGADHSWGSYHWARTSNPFTLQLGDNVSSTWDAHLGTASSDWSLSTVLNTTVVAGGTDPKKCRPTSGRVEVCAERYGRTRWLGVAQIWVSGSHITQAVSKMNNTYFNSAPYNTAAWRQYVMCQEVGHTFGLDHQDEIFDNANLGSCMDYTNDPDGPPSNEHPNGHDYDQLEAIYAHVDSATTVSNAAATRGMPPAMSQMDLEGPGQWGRLIRVSRDGRLALYELDFGRGFRVFTFVIWA